jgi:hypothetical protein
MEEDSQDSPCWKERNQRWIGERSSEDLSPEPSWVLVASCGLHARLRRDLPHLLVHMHRVLNVIVGRLLLLRRLWLLLVLLLGAIVVC